MHHIVREEDIQKKDRHSLINDQLNLIRALKDSLRVFGDEKKVDTIVAYIRTVDLNALAQKEFQALLDYSIALHELINAEVESKTDKPFFTALRKYYKAQLPLTEKKVMEAPFFDFIIKGFDQPIQDLYNKLNKPKPVDIPENTATETLLSQKQKSDLVSLCIELQDELTAGNDDKKTDDSKGKDGRNEKVRGWVDNTTGIIDAYSAKQVEIHDLANDKTLTAVEKMTKIEAAQRKFTIMVEGYENQFEIHPLGRQVFVAACTFVGGLLGATIGLALGALGGALIGGGLGSVAPVLGNIAGAVAGGSIGGLAGAIKGMGVGAVIGGAVAAAIMGLGAAYASKKGAGTYANTFFLNDKQAAAMRFGKELKKGISKEVDTLKRQIEADKKDEESRQPLVTQSRF